MPKKIPMRKCIATGEQFPKKELLRVVRTPEGQVVIDTTGRTNGHGAYLSKSQEAILKAQKTKALSRALEVDIPQEFYAELLAYIQK